MDPADEAALALFMGTGPRTIDLGAVIMEKIQQKESMAVSSPEVLHVCENKKLIHLGGIKFKT